MFDIEPARRAGRPLGAPETRRNCLDVAERLFAAGGFAGTGLRDIAARAGVTGATLAYHFGSKEKLYGAVLARIADSILPYLPPTPPMPSDPASVAGLIERFLDWALDHRHYATLLLRELMENPDRARKAKRWYLLPLIEAYAAAIRAGQERGTVGPVDPEMTAFHATGAITHFAASTVTIQRMLALDHEAEAVDRFRRTLRDSLVAMLAPAAAGEA
ncbi:MAG: TetR family transcriptional regulator [Thalassobaculum sp.]|uniref:TetR/AcrR family transcriptional regulator n=1 Tax=Thalassobaculum sp. TaxID=2022740 RepID=UPI0032EC1108